MTSAPFPDRPRVDAREKVLGAARYAADFAMPGMLYAMQVPATIAKGRVSTLATDAAMRVSGVVRILTAVDFPPPPAGGSGGPPPPPTITTDIAYRGQPIALVVAESLEAAIEGAEAVRATYATVDFTATIGDKGAALQPVEPTTGGDASKAMARAVTRHQAEYVSPPQHHNRWRCCRPPRCGRAAS